MKTRLATWFVFAAGGCVPLGGAAVEQKDHGRFEECTDTAGAAAWQEALVLLQEGRDSAAIGLLRTVVERCPEVVMAHCYYQDAALLVGGEAAAAMRHYYAGLVDDAASPVPAYARARLLESSYARMQAIDQLLRRHPGFAWGHLALARINRSSGRLGDAVDSYRRVLLRHPKLYEAHLELAETLVELGRDAEAQLPYENYLRAVPNDRAAIRAFVQLLIYRLDRSAAALPWLERLLRDDPRDESAWMDLAALRWRAGDPAAALQLYLQVLEVRPDKALAALNIGYLHYDALPRSEADRKEHWPKARKAFLLFLQLTRPVEGHEYFEQLLAVPYRLKEIERLLGPDDGTAPTLADLR